MKFKGMPNNLVRITKVRPHLVRKIPKAIRFDANGEYETENPYIIKRLSTKFEIVEEIIEEVIEELVEVDHGVQENEEEAEIDEDSIRLQAKEAGIKSWHVKSIENLIKELEV